MTEINVVWTEIPVVLTEVHVLVYWNTCGVDSNTYHLDWNIHRVDRNTCGFDLNTCGVDRNTCRVDRNTCQIGWNICGWGSNTCGVVRNTGVDWNTCGTDKRDWEKRMSVIGLITDCSVSQGTNSQLIHFYVYSCTSALLHNCPRTNFPKSRTKGSSADRCKIKQTQRFTSHILNGLKDVTTRIRRRRKNLGISLKTGMSWISRNYLQVAKGETNQI